ncbi:MAG TPA: signal peptide peptidase SppA [Terriglobales bacterium]|nr:signal peptide peptidase SppA [Terriglobales bacterium]
MTETKRSRTWLWVLLGGGFFFIFMVAVITLMIVAMHSDRKFSGFGDKIAVVDLEGVIIEPQTVVGQLKDFADDDSIKAIILHINTPGGGAAASQEIYTEVRRIRDEKKKTIVASVESVGASGGYYVASGTNKIYANPASVVGSIGVISEWINYEELMKWAKLKDVTLKAGALKDAGNPAREMTPEERAYFQSLIDDMHQQFISAVAEGRKMKVEDVKAIADGRVWTGQQALPLKLVDKLGDFQTAVDETAKSVGIKGEPELVRPQKDRRTLLDVLTGDVSNFVPDKAKMLDTHVGFYYLWK